MVGKRRYEARNSNLTNALNGKDFLIVSHQG